ncbi:hypothetical protein FO519_009542 [Halicephalobus sp. NKZ332]|nr:hypothetical protein FO519_009542 [Halicephalobus sp. NKZ332]
MTTRSVSSKNIIFNSSGKTAQYYPYGYGGYGGYGGYPMYGGYGGYGGYGRGMMMNGAAMEGAMIGATLGSMAGMVGK